MKIAKGMVAAIEYRLTNDQNELLDTSENRGPLVYLHGYGNLIPGMETALESKIKGDSFSVRIELSTLTILWPGRP